MIMPDRRAFLKGLAASGAALWASRTAAAATDWKAQPGIQLYTVRDLFAKDPEGTVAKVAELGFKEVEPTSYGNMEPKQFRALLDRHGLKAPSTHAGAAAGPNLEKQLEGFQIMGIQYTTISGGGGGGRGPRTEESTKRSADQQNKNGQIARKFGMKILIHNHTEEFELLEGSKLRMFDVQLAETDPALVTMELDIGWASVAGQNIVELFQKHPGRFELWHVKDAHGTKALPAQATIPERRRAAMLVPIGLGEVDYKTIFANAATAGLKHFYVEQDNAASWGDSMAAAKVSYQNLIKALG